MLLLLLGEVTSGRVAASGSKSYFREVDLRMHIPCAKLGAVACVTGKQPLRERPRKQVSAH